NICVTKHRVKGFLFSLLHIRGAKSVVVCTGTHNGLSMTGNSDNQYNLMKERYNNCNIVMGNIEVNMMEHTRDLSFLQSIKEVTGYVLIAVNQFSRLPLDNLRVIRGTTLYDDRYALAVMMNYQKDGQHGLQELGLTNLTEILEGGVKIIQNKYLSYAPQVNWLDIVKDTSAHILIEDNGPEKPCNEACQDVPCWGPGRNSCQTLTKTICAPQCNSRCFGRNPNECCHIECAGGCKGPLDTDCFACKNFNNSGSCVPQCPQTLIYNKHTFKMERNPNAKYQYGSICVAHCPKNFVVDDSSCVSSCPADKTEVTKNEVKRCEPCKGLCPKVCEGSQSGQSVDANNIDSFINCTKIQGSLNFLVTGIKGDEYNRIPALDPEKLKVFNTVEEITDFLGIQSWPESLSDLSVFSNLRTIQGRTLYKGYALLVMRIKSLTSLGLRSLQSINDGDIYITGNEKLCYSNTVNWTRITTKRAAIKENRAQKECVKAGLVCDPLCSSDGCWGPGPDQCVSCKKYSRGGTCVPNCMFLTGERREFATQSGECLPCHPDCKVQEGLETCTGPGADQCVACSRLKDGPHCVSSCPEGVMGGEGVIFKYANRQGHCEPCHMNCTQGCTGPGLWDCGGVASRTLQKVTGIVLGVIATIVVSFSIFVLTTLYRRGLAIRRKRAMRRYIENGESLEPLEEKEKVHARILKPSDLRKIKPLGNGAFGTVHKGVWIPEGDTVKLPVAIKTIHDRSGRQTFCKVTDHMITMGSLNHINVVRTLGLCPGDSLQLVTPLSNQGSLLEHVRNSKNKLNSQRLLNWCVQIAKGMNYLEEHRIVHRNLAARNVLLNNNLTAQISDYGIADLLYPDDKKYLYNEGKTSIIKWMALESILFRRYSHQSDVWSYGVTVWEMMSHGTEPYSTMRPQEVPDLLEKGERLSQPQICTIDVYMVMVKCWMIDENVRPTFKELAGEFTRMARDPPRYLVIKVRQGLFMITCIKITFIHFVIKVVLNPSTGVGYLPMNAGIDMVGQIETLKFSFIRPLRIQTSQIINFKLSSSEGCAIAVELEKIEDLSMAGSVKGRFQRQDSAYVSQRDSMSGGPPETPSPELEEEDQNGYVLPGGSPERGDNTISTLTVKEGEEDEYVENDDYHYTNKQPEQPQPLADNKDSCSDKNEAVEYEDMDCLVAPPTADDVVVYQNMQREGEGAGGATQAHPSGFESHIRVQAGVGEPTVNERSFDNPGYWHSKMFLTAPS
uniref:Receptor protein-tyrosine kinase n=1 Tax=Fundulus heteroclitus TaxID=8078 RepID=A0A3Q2P3Q2_FUNHE